jgi:hypothetical protein
LKLSGRPIGGKTDPAVREYWRKAKRKQLEKKEAS